MKRHENALGIMEGARNVRAIARSLAEAADEAAGEGVGAEYDAAVRLIVYRLARLCEVDEISYGYDSRTLNDTYCTLVKECRTRAVEGAMPQVRVVDTGALLHPERGANPEQVGAGQGDFIPPEIVATPEIVAGARRGGWRSLKEKFFHVRSE